MSVTFLGAIIRGCDTSIRLERRFAESAHGPADRRPHQRPYLHPARGRDPVHFEMGGFRFRGLLPQWAETRAIEGNPPYDVFVTDPPEIPDNAQLSSTWSRPNSAQCSLLVPAADSARTSSKNSAVRSRSVDFHRNSVAVAAELSRQFRKCLVFLSFSPSSPPFHCSLNTRRVLTMTDLLSRSSGRRKIPTNAWSNVGISSPLASYGEV